MKGEKIAFAVLILSGHCLILSGTEQLQLRKTAGKAASAELLTLIREGNQAWLDPNIKQLSYTFAMKHTDKNDGQKIAIHFNAPDKVLFTKGDGPPSEHYVDDSYDVSNSAWPPRLTTIRQGVTFFGPIHELYRAPGDHALRLLGEDLYKDRKAYILHLIPTGKPSKRAMERWENRLRECATRPSYIYELMPTVREVNGDQHAEIDLRCIYKKGPGWQELQKEHEKNPARLKWNSKTYTAILVEEHNEFYPVIVIDDYRSFQISNGLFLEEGEDQFNEGIYQQLREKLPPPKRYLSMRVGCGVWGSWYGYSGGGAEIDQVWIDKEIGAVLREEGYIDGKCRFVVEYDDFEELEEKRYAPRNVIVTLLGGKNGAWVFDMYFSTHGGKAWLLGWLVESFENRGVTTTAEVSEVSIE